MRLHHTREGQREGHEPHTPRRDPEAPHVQDLIVWWQVAQIRHGVAEDREIQHHVGAVEGEMGVRCRYLRSVRVVVDPGQRVHEAPNARSEESGRRAADRPNQRGRVRMPNPIPWFIFRRKRQIWLLAR